MQIKIRDAGDIIILDIIGDFTLAHPAEVKLDTVIKEKMGRGKNNFLLNLRDMVFLDSSGIGEIVASLIFVQESGGNLKITNISDKVMLIFRYSRLTDIFEIYKNEKEALQSFQ